MQLSWAEFGSTFWQPLEQPDLCLPSLCFIFVVVAIVISFQKGCYLTLGKGTMCSLLFIFNSGHICYNILWCMHNVEEYPHSYASLHIWWYFKQMYLHRPLLYAVKKKMLYRRSTCVCCILAAGAWYHHRRQEIQWCVATVATNHARCIQAGSTDGFSLVDRSSVQFSRTYEVNYILFLGILKIVAMSLEIFSRHHKNCVQTWKLVMKSSQKYETTPFSVWVSSAS